MPHVRGEAWLKLDSTVEISNRCCNSPTAKPGHAPVDQATDKCIRSGRQREGGAGAGRGLRQAGAASVMQRVFLVRDPDPVDKASMPATRTAVYQRTYSYTSKVNPQTAKGRNNLRRLVADGVQAAVTTE